MGNRHVHAIARRLGVLGTGSSGDGSSGDSSEIKALSCYLIVLRLSFPSRRLGISAHLPNLFGRRPQIWRIAARKAAIDSERRKMESDYAGHMAPKEEKARRAQTMLAKSTYPAFVSIRVAWLRKQLGRGRPEET